MKLFKRKHLYRMIGVTSLADMAKLLNLLESRKKSISHKRFIATSELDFLFVEIYIDPKVYLLMLDEISRDGYFMRVIGDNNCSVRFQKKNEEKA